MTVVYSDNPNGHAEPNVVESLPLTDTHFARHTPDPFMDLLLFHPSPVNTAKVISLPCSSIP